MNDPKTVMKVARRFAELVAEYVGPDDVDMIDKCNLYGCSPEVCHSHDYCDANVFMQQAMIDTVGVDPADVSYLSSPERLLWQEAWDTTKRIGFRRLSMVRGMPEIPADAMKVAYDGRGNMTATLPGLRAKEEHPLEVSLDFWGRNPRLQMICYNHADPEGEPKVFVRYDSHGRVVEVVVTDKEVLVLGDFDLTRVRSSGHAIDTPWEVERDANPPCMEGDNLQMPSGLKAKVMRLRDRYDDDIESFRAYDATYDILGRLDSHPGSDKRNQVYDSIEQAWDVNPLTAGTVEPSDFSFVPEWSQPSEK